MKDFSKLEETSFKEQFKKHENYKLETQYKSDIIC